MDKKIKLVSKPVLNIGIFLLSNYGGVRLDKDVKITVRNHYVTNFICDIDG